MFPNALVQHERGVVNETSTVLAYTPRRRSAEPKASMQTIHFAAGVQHGRVTGGVLAGRGRIVFFLDTWEPSASLGARGGAIPPAHFGTEQRVTVEARRLRWGGFVRKFFQHSLELTREPLAPASNEAEDPVCRVAFEAETGVIAFDVFIGPLNERHMGRRVVQICPTGEVRELAEEDIETVVAADAGVDFETERASFFQEYNAKKAEAEAFKRSLPGLRWTSSSNVDGENMRAWFLSEHPAWQWFVERQTSPELWEMSLDTDYRSHFRTSVHNAPSEEAVTMLARAETDDVLAAQNELIVSPAMLEGLPSFDFAAVYIAQAIQRATERRALITYPDATFPAGFFAGFASNVVADSSSTSSLVGSVRQIDPRRFHHRDVAIAARGRKFRDALVTRPLVDFEGHRIYVIAERGNSYIGLVEGSCDKYMFPKYAFTG